MKTSKIGRNDPCSCGSGKKYKTCCIYKADDFMQNDYVSENSSQFERLLKEFDNIDLLKKIAALQLLPLNHGKNVRLEFMAKQSFLADNVIKRPQIGHAELRAFYANNFTFHYLEDPVTSHFTENVVFMDGNYTVFPGLNHAGSLILNTYLEAIFIMNNSLPLEFKKRIRDGVTLILSMSESMAKHIGLERNIFEQDTSSSIWIPGETILKRCQEAVVFQIDFVKRIANYYNINWEIINDFIIDSNDVMFLNSDADKNPMLLRPIVKHGQQLIFALPTVVVNCLTEYINQTAKLLECSEHLLQVFYRYQWNRTRKLCYGMDWGEVRAKLPKSNIEVYDSVFKFDSDKLAYVRLVDKGSFKLANESAGEKDGNHYTNTSDILILRTNQIIEYLNNLNGEQINQYFVIYVIAQTGSDFFFSIGDSELSNQTISISYSDFEKIVYSEGSDHLSLWKFAKVYGLANRNNRFFSIGGILDSYVAYVNNNQSLLPSDDKRPNVISFMPGNSADFQRKVIKDKDEHSVFRFTENGLIPVIVKRLRSFAPIFAEREAYKRHYLVLDFFRSPIWIKNDQVESDVPNSVVNLISEAILFWLYKMAPSLNQYIEKTEPTSIEMVIELAPQYFEPFYVKDIPEIEEEIEIKLSKEEIRIVIPFSFAKNLNRSDNSGEKVLMQSVLKGLGMLLDAKMVKFNFNGEQIVSWVEQYMHQVNAKMIIFFDSSIDLRLDNRWLVPLRTIQDSEISNILDNLVSYLKPSQNIPVDISNPKEKVGLCNRIVVTLINRIVEKLREFDAVELIKWILKLYETCVQTREFREILIPARIACFSDFPTEIERLHRNEADLVSTSISMRCLIEFITATPAFGIRQPNFDDLDGLLALMDQVISWGTLSDSIEYNIDNPKIGILPSGRIGTDKDFSDMYFSSFAKVRIEYAVNNYVEHFERKFRVDIVAEKKEDISEVLEINDAIKDEWGLSLTQIIQLSGVLVQIALEGGDSVGVIEETALKKEIESRLVDMYIEDINAGLQLLTLESRLSLDKAPVGFEKTDIYPWKYNRELSYLRKPIIKILHPDGRAFCYWGFRHVLTAIEHLQYLLFTGKLKARKGGKLAKLLARINNEKGHNFRDEVVNWLNLEGSLRIIPYEVKIAVNGHLKTERNEDKGDVDIMAIDDRRKILFSIECKNTVSARAIHEMKTEMDLYLGRDGAPGLIEKHVQRDIWLNNHKDQLTMFGDDVKNYSIKSLVLTSQEIPLTYLSKERLPLKFLSFQALRRIGIKIL